MAINGHMLMTTKTAAETVVDLKAAMELGGEAKMAAAKIALWRVTGCREVVADAGYLHLVIEMAREGSARDRLQDMVRALDVFGIPTMAVLPPIHTTNDTWRAVIVL